MKDEGKTTLEDLRRGITPEELRKRLAEKGFRFSPLSAPDPCRDDYLPMCEVEEYDDGCEVGHKPYNR